jgi:hypothetical protein
VAFRQQPLADVRSEKTGTSGHHYPRHVSLPR